MEELKNGVATFYASSRAAWRTWLYDNHATEKSVWLIIYKKQSGIPTVTYDEAVDEALCFGWIDSKPNKRDADSYYQFFSLRKPNSNWSAVNKNKVRYLTAQGLMTPAGQKMIDLAKATGTWEALEVVDALTLPEDLKIALKQYPDAERYFEAFPKSVKKGILEWILNAKTPATRQKRINETAAKASVNERANQYQPKN